MLASFPGLPCFFCSLFFVFTDALERHSEKRGRPGIIQHVLYVGRVWPNHK